MRRAGRTEGWAVVAFDDAGTAERFMHERDEAGG
jgi:hypothetical protein